MKKIPYGRQNLDKQDIESVLEVLKSDWLTQGPKVPEFEEFIKHYCKAKYAVAMTNATSALHATCLALSIGQNDIVWTSSISFVASANAPLYCGAKIDFVDINANSLNICPEKLLIKLKHAEILGSLPKLIIVVHMGGASADMQKINELKKQYNFKIIEDASHAIGGEYNSKKIGSCEYSDACIFSFHPVKIITTGEGGLITTNSFTIDQRLRLLRSHGIVRDGTDEEVFPENEIWNYNQTCLGYNYRMTDIQAALGISQFSKLDNFVYERNTIAKNYIEKTFTLPFSFQTVLTNSRSSYHLCVIILDEPFSHLRNNLYDYLIDHNIAVNLHYNPIYLQPFYKRLGFKSGYCENAETYSKSAITLPLYPGLALGDFEWIISKIHDFFNKGALYGK